MIKIKSPDFSSELGKILAKYSDDVTESVRRVVKKAGSEARDRLKETSPKLTGEYAKGWKVSYTWHSLGADAKVHQGTAKYRLTHLLENGHANRGGGRTPAHVHIKPVEEAIVPEVEKNIRQLIKDGL